MPDDLTIEQVELPGMPEKQEPPPPEPFVWKGHVEVRTDIEVDLAALIRRFPTEYAAIVLRGHQEWERPMQFLWEYLEEATECYVSGQHVTDTWTDFEVDDVTRWKQADFEKLCEICPEARLTDT